MGWSGRPIRPFVEGEVTLSSTCSKPSRCFGLAEARVHARIWAALASKGEMIGAHELAVAATALAGDASVATLNIKEFERVPGLALAPTTVFRRD
jgi:hypothetical protein